MSNDRYNPRPFDVGAVRDEWMRDPAFKSAYESLDDEFATLDVLLNARRQAGLTQEEVATRMGIKQPSLARIEASLGSRKHAPSLTTLRKYAEAVGCKLEIKLTPR